MTITRQCNVCGELLTSDETDESHTPELCRAWASQSVNMKALLGVAVRQAVHLALVDSAENEGSVARRRWLDDIHSIPLHGIDPEALAKNVANRLLGSGGWCVNGVYAGNATPRQVLEASIARPDMDPITEFILDLGLTPSEWADEDGN